MLVMPGTTGSGLKELSCSMMEITAQTLLLLTSNLSRSSDEWISLAQRSLSESFLARLWPFTPHNTRRQLSAPAKSAGLLKHLSFDSTLKNGNCTTNNALQSQWRPRRSAVPSHTKQRCEQA